MVVAGINFAGGAAAAWTLFLTFIPKLLGFVLVLLVGLLIAKAISKTLLRLLQRFGFENAIDRGGIRKLLASSKVHASDLLARLVYYALGLIVLQLAFGMFGTNPVSQMLDRAVIFLPKIFVAIVIVVVASTIAASVKKLVAEALGALSYGRFLANSSAAVIIVIGAVMALNQIQIAPAIIDGFWYAALLAIAGTTIVAVGGGGIMPMRRYWEKSLDKMEQESGSIRDELSSRPIRNAQPLPEDRYVGVEGEAVQQAEPSGAHRKPVSSARANPETITGRSQLPDYAGPDYDEEETLRTQAIHRPEFD